MHFARLPGDVAGMLKAASPQSELWELRDRIMTEEFNRFVDGLRGRLETELMPSIAGRRKTA